MALRPLASGNPPKSPASPASSRQHSPSGSPRGSMQLRPIQEELEPEFRLTKSSVVPANDPIIYERVEQRDNIKFVPVITQSAKKRRLSQLEQSQTDLLEPAPPNSFRSRSGSTPAEPTNRKLFGLMFQADPSVPSTLTEPEFFSLRLRDSEWTDPFLTTKPEKSERRKSFEPKLLERSPGVARVAESLQLERCKLLERQIHELRLENDLLRDDVMKVRARLQDLRSSSDTPPPSQGTPSKRDSLSLRERELMRKSEQDQDMIRELMNTIARLHAETEELRVQATVNEGLLKLSQLDEFTKTIEDKERIILELNSQLESLQQGLRTSSVIYPPSAPISARDPSSGDLSMSSEITADTETPRSSRGELFEDSQRYEDEDGVMKQLKGEIAALKASLGSDVTTQLQELQHLLQKKDETLAEYELSMRQLQEQLTTLETKETAYLQQRLLLESELDSVKSELQSLRSSLAEELEDRWRTMSHEADLLKEEINLKNQTIHDLQEVALPTLNAELNEARTNLSRSQTNLSAANARLSTFQDEISALKHDVARLESSLPNVTAEFELQLASLTFERESLLEKVAKLESLVLERENEINRLRSEQDSREAHLSALERSLEQVTAQISEIEGHKAESHSEALAKAAQAELLHSSSVELNQLRIAKLETELQEKDSQLASYQSALEVAQSQLARELGILQNLLSDKSDELAAAQSEIKKLKGDLETAKHKPDSSYSEKASVALELTETLERLEASNRELRELVSAKQSTIDQLIDREANALKEVGETAIQLERCQHELARSEVALGEATVLRHEIDRLTADKAQTKVELDEARLHLSEAQNRIADLLQSMSQTEKKLLAEQVSVRQQQSENQELQRALKESKSDFSRQIDLLQSTLHSQGEELIDLRSYVSKVDALRSELSIMEEKALVMEEKALVDAKQSADLVAALSRSEDLRSQREIELASAAERLSTLELELQRVLSEKNALEHVLQETRGELQSMRSDFSSKLIEASEATRKLESDHASQLSLLQEAQKDLSLSRAALGEKIADLRRVDAELESLRHSAAAQASDLREMSMQLTKFQSQSRDYLAQVAVLETELETLRQARSADDAAVLHLRDGVESLRAQLSAAELAKAELLQQLRNQEAARDESLQSLKTSLILGNNDKLKQLEDEHLAARSRWQADYVLVEAKLQELELSLQTKSLEVDRLQSTMKETESDKQSLRDQLALKTNERDAAVRDIDTIRSELASLEKSKNAEIEALRLASDQLVQRIQQSSDVAEPTSLPTNIKLLDELETLRKQLESERRANAAKPIHPRRTTLWKLFALFLLVVVCAIAVVSTAFFSSEIEDGARHQLGLYLRGFV